MKGQEEAQTDGEAGGVEEDDSTKRVKSLGVRKVTGLGKKEGSRKGNGQEITGESGRGVGREQRRQNDENAQGHT